jgi:hypothetical protein
MLPAVAKAAPRSARKSRRQKRSENVIGPEMIFQRLLYETLIYGPNNEQTSIVADIDADGLWLKRLHFICIKSPKVICRAVHDATLTTQQENSKNSVALLLLLYYRFKL